MGNFGQKIADLLRLCANNIVAPTRKSSQSGLTFREFPAGWESATRTSSGYSDSDVIDAVRKASAQVRDGKVEFERDGVTFSKIQYAWPLLAGLLLSAARNDSTINMLDFGGALGSSYFQNRKYLRLLRAVNWMVVEQPEFASIGNNEFANEELTFHKTFEAACAHATPSIVLFGSSLQYLPDPYKQLRKASLSSASDLIIDRTPVHDGPRDLVVLQTVPKNIYDASYPAWIFSRQKLLSTLAKHWTVLEEFPSIGGKKATDRDTPFEWRGIHLVRNPSSTIII